MAKKNVIEGGRGIHLDTLSIRRFVYWEGEGLRRDTKDPPDVGVLRRDVGETGWDENGVGCISIPYLYQSVMQYSTVTIVSHLVDRHFVKPRLTLAMPGL
jgi:hypothetical protein